MQATLSHYRILEQIGAGGMGVVYRARDERLDRDVALKVLPSGALADEAGRKRFRKEALALSKLNHPNIATIFDFDTQDGTDFLVEEVIPGLSLDEMLAAGALSDKEIINLGSQLCEGLAAAHEQGVVHRDLKPANVRVTPDARVKILDFGLAKILPASGAAGSDTKATASLTETQTISGTPPYMAPEQLLNQTLDLRTDLWAVGCVLYEMATGQRPFQGSGPVLTEAILHREPALPSELNPKLSPALEAIILKCLEKEAELRYGSAREVAIDLRRALTSSDLRRTTTAAGRIRALAVLPLYNLAALPEQDYFVDGMTELLITELAQIRALRVISRTTAMRYKGSTKTVPEIARELGVDGIVEGSVQRAGDRVRVTAQLIEARSDRHLWARSYERDLRDVFGLQSELARAITEEIQVTLTPQERGRLAASKRVDPVAYDIFLHGLHQFHMMTPKGFTAAIESFQRATAADPTFALAHAWLAHAFSFVGYWSAAREHEAYAKAKTAALRAIELDPSCSVAYSALSSILWLHDWDPEAGLRAIEQAVELNPGDAHVHMWHAVFLAVWREDKAGALREIRRAQELDPCAPMVAVILGWIYIWIDDFQAAMAHCRNMLAVAPHTAPLYSILGRAQDATGDYEGAITSLERAVELESRAPIPLAWLGAAYAMAGQEERALAILAELKERAKTEAVIPICFAFVYTGLHRRKEALEAFERAFQARNSQIYWLKVVPFFDYLRDDPRYWDLVRRLGLSEGRT